MTIDLRVRALFERLLLCDPAEREVVFEREGIPAPTRAAVLELLRHHDASEELLAKPAVEQFASLLRTPGRSIGEFRIIRRIGHGAAGTVFLAEDTVLEREVAVKVLAAPLGLSTIARAQFLREARAAARLDHPNIVRVFRYDVCDDTPFIAMQYVSGETFAQWLARPSGERGDPEWWESMLRIFTDLAGALDYAHRQDVIHRDVKPRNILMTPSGAPMLADFGIARIVDADSEITSAGAGSPHYMSPEQITDPDGIDPRTDIFSLGAVLYEALSGRRPFTGETPEEVKAAVVSVEPPRLRSIDRRIRRDLETICHKALEKNPRDRYQTAAHVAADLRCAARGDPILARPPGLLRRVRREVHRHRSTVAVCLVLGLATALIAMVWLDNQRRAAAACRLEVTTTPGDAAVRLYAVEGDGDRLHAAELLGRSPVRRAQVHPGRYRIVARLDDGRFGEADVRLLEPGTVLAMHLVLADTADLESGMVRIEGGTFSLGSDALEGPYQQPRTIRLAGFLIDRREVSNAEYLAFLRAVGREAPAHWPGDPDDDFLTLPVVALRQEEMEEYARWSGKRLPSAAEWEAAYRSLCPSAYPWGSVAPAAWPVADPDDRLAAGSLDAATLQRLYRRYVRAADEPEAPGVPVLHLVGNVCEMTSSWDAQTGRVAVIKGGSWRTGWSTFDPALAPTIPASTGHYEIGFRCARSLNPFSSESDG